LTLVAVLLLVGAGCGGGDDDGDGDGAGATTTTVKGGGGEQSLACAGQSPDPTRGITDTTIRIGGVATLTSTGLVTFAGVEEGARIRFARANAEGGVHGRTIDFVGVRDDGQDNTRNADAVKKLVQQDKVFAVGPVITVNLGGFDFLCQQVVPFFGWGISPAFCDNAIAFGFTGCLVQPKQTVGSGLFGELAARHIGGAKGKTAAVLAEDNDSGKAGVKQIAESARRAGFDVVYDEAVLPATGGIADPTPFVDDLLTADDGDPPDVVFQISSAQSVFTMTGALKRAGYEGFQVNAVAYDPRLAGFADDLEGSGVIIQFAPFEATEVPAVKQLQTDIEQYGGGNVLLTQPLAAGYWSADVFLAMLEEAGRDLTADSFLAAVNDGFEYGVEGAIGTSTWPDNHRVPVPCGSLVLFEKGKYELAEPLTCAELYDL
jgi:ABC-type branched-subunit amino acid transport system substrate-binding protein